MTVSLRLSEEDGFLIKKYAEMHGLSLSELFRESVLERIEDEYDLQAYERVMAEHAANPITYAHEDVWNMLDLAE